MQQRELKFRVWDILAKQFFYSDKGYQGHFILTLNGQFYNLQNGSGGDEYIVQQYIGLNDKNGKEIYEGDIVNFRIMGITHGPESENIENAEVFYDVNNCCFCFGKYITNDYIDYSFCFADNIDRSSLEVVGNVCEENSILNKPNVA